MTLLPNEIVELPAEVQAKLLESLRTEDSNAWEACKALLISAGPDGE